MGDPHPSGSQVGGGVGGAPGGSHVGGGAAVDSLGAMGVAIAGTCMRSLDWY